MTNRQLLIAKSAIGLGPNGISAVKNNFNVRDVNSLMNQRWMDMVALGWASGRTTPNGNAFSLTDAGLDQLRSQIGEVVFKQAA